MDVAATVTTTTTLTSSPVSAVKDVDMKAVKTAPSESKKSSTSKSDASGAMQSATGTPLSKYSRPIVVSSRVQSVLSQLLSTPLTKGCFPNARCMFRTVACLSSLLSEVDSLALPYLIGAHKIIDNFATHRMAIIDKFKKLDLVLAIVVRTPELSHVITLKKWQQCTYTEIVEHYTRYRALTWIQPTAELRRRIRMSHETAFDYSLSMASTVRRSGGALVTSLDGKHSEKQTGKQPLTASPKMAATKSTAIPTSSSSSSLSATPEPMATESVAIAKESEEESGDVEMTDSTTTTKAKSMSTESVGSKDKESGEAMDSVQLDDAAIASGDLSESATESERVAERELLLKTVQLAAESQLDEVLAENMILTRGSYLGIQGNLSQFLTSIRDCLSRDHEHFLSISVLLASKSSADSSMSDVCTASQREELLQQTRAILDMLVSRFYTICHSLPEFQWFNEMVVDSDSFALSAASGEKQHYFLEILAYLMRFATALLQRSTELVQTVLCPTHVLSMLAAICQLENQMMKGRAVYRSHLVALMRRKPIPRSQWTSKTAAKEDESSRLELLQMPLAELTELNKLRPDDEVLKHDIFDLSAPQIVDFTPSFKTDIVYKKQIRHLFRNFYAVFNSYLTAV